MRNFLFVILFAVAATVTAQVKNERPTSYNYLRGVEAIQLQNNTEALEYLNKEIEENPKNGYAYSWIAMIHG